MCRLARGLHYERRHLQRVTEEKAMKNIMKRTAAAGALLMLSGAAAFAQSEMKVEVPFTFHVVGATMAPGKYAIVKVPTNTAPYFRLRHENGKTVLVAPQNTVQPKKLESRAEVAFQCAGEYCALQSINTGFGSAIAVVPVRMKPAFRGEKVAEVRIPANR